MLNTALSAILITIATPLQFALTLLFSIPAGLWCKNKLDEPKVYPHLDINKAKLRLKFCLDVYGSNHPQTDIALQECDAALTTAWRGKYIDLEDLEMYLELGICTGSLFDRLTAAA